MSSRKNGTWVSASNISINTLGSLST